jgi:hypothetical protein
MIERSLRRRCSLSERRVLQPTNTKFNSRPTAVALQHCNIIIIAHRARKVRTQNRITCIHVCLDERIRRGAIYMCYSCTSGSQSA